MKSLFIAFDLWLAEMDVSSKKLYLFRVDMYVTVYASECVEV